MSINTERWAQRKSEIDKKIKERQEGKMWTKIEEGEYLCYVHPQVYPNDKHEHTGGFNFIEVSMHYGLGGKKNGQLCLDYKTNPILSHPLLQSFVANREKNSFKITPKLTCEVCEGLENGEITNDKNKQQLKWIIGLTPMFYRKDKNDKWTRLKFKPRFLTAGTQIFNGYMNSLIDLAGDGIDPTDPNAAVLLKLSRKGTEFNTEYEVVTHIASARKPIKLDKAQREIIAKAVRPKGELDLFSIVASFTKSPSQITALIAGVSDRNVEDEEAEVKKECFGKSWTDDEECRECGDSEECMKACGKKPKKIEAQSPSNKQGKSGGKTQSSQAAKSEHESEEEPSFESQMECFGNYSDSDEACNNCDEAEQCCEETQDGEESNDESEQVDENEEEEIQRAEDASEEDSDDLPNCYRQYDGDDEGCAGCDVKERCEADSVVDDSNSQVPDEDEPEAGGEEDPDIASLKEEAERLANKARGRGRGRK